MLSDGAWPSENEWEREDREDATVVAQKDPDIKSFERLTTNDLSALSNRKHDEMNDVGAIERGTKTTGAAVTAIPNKFLLDSVGNGSNHRITTRDEGTQLQRCAKDTTASASRIARNGWITERGGFLIPDDSALSHKIKKMISGVQNNFNLEMKVSVFGVAAGSWRLETEQGTCVEQSWRQLWVGRCYRRAS